MSEVTPNPADEVVIQAPETKVNVDVTPSSPEPKQEAPRQDDQILKLHRRMEYQARQFERAMEQIKSLSEKLSTPAPQAAPKPDSEVDEVDEIAQRDWKRGVKMVVRPEIEQTVEEILTKRDQERLKKQEVETAQTLQQKSMATVYEAHPEIEDEDSEFTRAYTQVLNEDPYLRNNPLGPELAMARAERRLNSAGKIKGEVTETNAQRVTRVQSSYAPAGRTPSTGKSNILTTEEKRICDEKGIKYEEYTKMRSLNQNDYRNGVTVDE